MKENKTYTLIGVDNRPYTSEAPGKFGGHRKTKVYGHMDCSAALRAIAKGGYVGHRVFSLMKRQRLLQDTAPAACACVRNIKNGRAKTNSSEHVYLIIQSFNQI